MDLCDKLSTRFISAVDTEVSTIKILIIDDNKSNQLLLRTYLLNNDFKDISTAEWNAVTAVSHDFDPDIILAGIGVDKKDCIEILKSIIVEEERKEIIILAEYTEIKLSLQALRLGVCDIITSPICPDDLDRALDKAVKRLHYKKKQEHFLTQIDTVIREKTQQFLETEGDLIPKKHIQGMIHNINGPLSVISGNAQLLEIGLEDVDMFLGSNYSTFPPSVYHELVKKIDRYRQYLSNILESGEKMRDMITSFLTKWKRDNTSLLEPLDINEMVRLEVEYLNADMRFKNDLKKQYVFTENIPPITAIYSDFSQTFHNLVQNALDAMYDSPVKELKLVTRHDDKMIYIEIHDTGCGIPHENIEKIFTPFFTTKIPVEGNGHRPSGTGLGLANCIDLMKSYNASFTIQSEVGKGTCILWQIPKKQHQKEPYDRFEHQKRF